MKSDDLNGREETFCLNVAGGSMSDSDAARLAGYCPDNPQNAHTMVFYLYKRQRVHDRIAELRKAASDKAILTLVQQKIILSEIAQARMIDFRDEHGVIRPLDKDMPNPSAISSVEYAYDPIKREPYPVRISLRDPVKAIVELCKLEGLYPGRKAVSVTVAPVTSVSMDQARAKLSARLEVMGKRPGSGAVESDDIDSLVGDGCSEEQHNNNSEV